MAGKRSLERALWKFLDASWYEWLSVFASVVSVVLLIWLVIRIRTWFREDEDPAAPGHEMLVQFQDLYRQGDLSEEEFRSIKGQLIDRIEGSPKCVDGDND